MKKTHAIVIIILLSSVFTPRASGTPPLQAFIKVFRDGWTKIIEKYNVTQNYFLLHLPPHTEIVAVLLNNKPIEYGFNNSIIYIELNQPAKKANLTIIYYTPEYTKKIGTIWILSLNYTSTQITVQLPENTTIAGLNKIPQQITFKNKNIVLVFSQGPIQIKYILAPLIHEQKQAITNASTSESTAQNKTTQPSKTNQNQKTNNQTQNKPVQPSTSTSPTPPKTGIDASKNGGFYTNIAIAAAITAFLILTYLYLREKRKQIYVRLSEGEAEILSILKDLGGKALQSDVIRLSGLPKTTAWRYIKKLEEKRLIKIKRQNKENLLILK